VISNLKKIKQIQTVAQESRLYFVDLAGSERQKDTNASGKRLQEAKNINTSLMMLGRVIGALSEKGKKNERIPYRDSKLTHLLAASLGGNAKTAMIATISADRENLDQTLSTLQFATRAKTIKNHAQINQLMSLETDLENSWNDIVVLRSRLESLKTEKQEKLRELASIQESMECEYERSRQKVSESKNLLAGVDQKAMTELGPLVQQLKLLQREEAQLTNEMKNDDNQIILNARKQLTEGQQQLKRIERELGLTHEAAARQSKQMAEEIGTLQRQIREKNDNARILAKRRQQALKIINFQQLLIRPEVKAMIQATNDCFLARHPNAPDLNPSLPLGLFVELEEESILLAKRLLPEIQYIENSLVPNKVNRNQFWINFFSHLYALKKQIIFEQKEYQSDQWYSSRASETNKSVAKLSTQIKKFPTEYTFQLNDLATTVTSTPSFTSTEQTSSMRSEANDTLIETKSRTVTKTKDFSMNRNIKFYDNITTMINNKSYDLDTEDNSITVGEGYPQIYRADYQLSVSSDQSDHDFQKPINSKNNKMSYTNKFIGYHKGSVIEPF